MSVPQSIRSLSAIHSDTWPEGRTDAVPTSGRPVITRGATPLRIGLALALLALAVGTPTARADLTLAAQSGCLACHQVDSKILGPAYKDVAAKYRGDAAAAAMLEAKVKNGGVGTWGQVPIPPNVAVDPAAIKQLVAWILSL
jgi:cytochrome c